MVEPGGDAGLERLLADVAAGRLSAAEALTILRSAPHGTGRHDGASAPAGATRSATAPAATEDLGFARIDHDRLVRLGMPEVVYGAGKTAPQIAGIVASLKTRGHTVLVTRLAEDVWSACRDQLDDGDRAGHYDALARTWTWLPSDAPRPADGDAAVLIVSAGTSDLPVAEEAARTAEAFGQRVERLVDVGVAGIHRLLEQHDTLQRAAVVIVAAGMEGALPSVVAGLVGVPVVAVPTSVGYGASFEGLAALLAMLNSCAAGVTVVNIDNGFGAACAAVRLARSVERHRDGAGA